jgi:hypothetical protein
MRVHWFYKQATLVDVLEARNYVVRVIIKLVQFANVLSAAAVGIWASRHWDRDGLVAGPFAGCVGWGGLYFLHKRLFDDVESDVKNSERQCHEARVLREKSETEAQREIDRLEAELVCGEFSPESPRAFGISEQLQKVKKRLEIIQRL